MCDLKGIQRAIKRKKKKTRAITGSFPLHGSVICSDVSEFQLNGANHPKHCVSVTVANSVNYRLSIVSLRLVDKT